MHIRYGFRLEAITGASTPVAVMLDIHPSRRHDLTQADDLVATALADPTLPIPQTLHVDRFGNLRRDLAAPAGGLSLTGGGVIFDPGFPDTAAPGAGETPRDALPAEALPFLEASRFCDGAPLAREAQHLLAAAPPGWRRVQAVTDMVHRRLGFGERYAREGRTAAEAFHERVGVARDFAHVAIAFCRALGIPARYVTGYLPEIGTSPAPGPMRFHAWFEAFLDGHWYTFDARHNVPRIGRIPIGFGRDAGDVPFVDAGAATIETRLDVTAEEIRGQRFPVSPEDRRAHAAETASRRRRTDW